MNHGFLYLPAAFALACVSRPLSRQLPRSLKRQRQRTTRRRKLPWGDPDLQGEWPAFANIPMQRPASFGTRAYSDGRGIRAAGRNRRRSKAKPTAKSSRRRQAM